MARVCWSDKGEESVLGIGRYIIEQTQSCQRGIDIITKIEEKCAQYAEFPLISWEHHEKTLARDFDAFLSTPFSSSTVPAKMASSSF